MTEKKKLSQYNTDVYSDGVCLPFSTVKGDFQNFRYVYTNQPSKRSIKKKIDFIL